MSKLSAKNWFCDLWQLCTHFHVLLTVHEENHISLVRDKDRAIMECFIDLGVFNVEQWCVLGRYIKFFAVHSLAEVLCCDGCTVQNDVLEYRRGTSKRTYPHKNPQRCDLDL